MEIEPIEHILFRCSWTNEVLHNCRLSFPTRPSSVTSTVKLFHDIIISALCQGNGNNSLALSAQIYWSIWKGSNEFVFSNFTPDPLFALESALTSEVDFIAFAYSQFHSPVNRDLGDCNASQSFRFLGIIGDGAFATSIAIVAFAVIPRNHSGEVRDINSSLAAEAWAIRVACPMFHVRGRGVEAVIESHCANLIHSLSSESRNLSWDCQVFIDDILALKSNLVCNFCWYNRIGWISRLVMAMTRFLPQKQKNKNKAKDMRYWM